MEISMKELFDLAGKNPVNNHKLVVGKKYLFRTVTMIYTGELVDQFDDCFLITKAAWIADTGRWSENIVSCEFSEVEPYPEEKIIPIYKSGMLDIVEINTLPTRVK